MLSAFVYQNNFLITEYKTFPLYTNSMHILLVLFYNIFVGVQVISQAGARGHWVVTFVLHFSAGNLATLVHSDIEWI
jgi:hypothetical protein